MKITKKILHTIALTLLSLIVVFSLSSCGHNSIEKEANEILKEDLDTSVEIIKLYYNEEKQGYFVEFQTNSYTDKAAINLDTGVIEYESEFNDWSTKIGEHEYNQKIINSFYAEWSFSVAVFEHDGRPKDSDWERVK